ncbi:MAG: Uma2 family endonuclease [Cyanobacteria bacterium P01_D01_bin.73]
MTLTLAKWSLDDYHRMVDAGLLAERRVELIDGDIVEMVPEGPEHAGRGETLAMILRRKLGDRAWIREARPIELANSEPEPDIAVVNPAKVPYLSHHPRVEDIFLVIEISKSTLQTDLTRKRDLYARSGIPEYWVVDLQNRRLEVFRSPNDGTYQEQRSLENTGEAIAPIAFPDCLISPNAIFS